jgi:hypothetical protein
MLAKLLEFLSLWFLVAVIVGLLAVNLVSVSPEEAPAPDFTPFPEADRKAALLNELEGDETLDLARAQMHAVR